MSAPSSTRSSTTDRLLDFTGTRVVVTGAGRGIGAGIARRFATAGADLAVVYRASAEPAQQQVEAITGMGRRAIAVQADVTQRGDVERVVATCAEELGGIDILINNAGVYPLSPLLETTDEEWDAVIDANLKGVFLCTQLVGQRLVVQGTGGAIINIASIEATSPAPMHAHYNAAKAGVRMHTRAAAAELGSASVRVNTVSPGLIDQPGLGEAWPEGVARYCAAAPLGRLGTPDDVADACLFLASPAARWITGVDLVVDGGVLTQQTY